MIGSYAYHSSDKSILEQTPPSNLHHDATLPDLPDYIYGAELRTDDLDNVHTDDLDNGPVYNTRTPSPDSASSIYDDPADPVLGDDYVSPDAWSSDDESHSKFTSSFLQVYYANLAPSPGQSDLEMSTVDDDLALDDELPNPGQSTPLEERKCTFRNLITY